MKRANFPGRKNTRRRAALTRLEEKFKRLKGKDQRRERSHVQKQIRDLRRNLEKDS